MAAVGVGGAGVGPAGRGGWAGLFADDLGMDDVGRLFEESAHNPAPGLEVFGFAEMFDMVFQRLPVDLQDVLFRVLDDVVQLQAVEAASALEQRQCLLYAGFEVGLGTGFYSDMGHFADHVGFLVQS